MSTNKPKTSKPQDRSVQRAAHRKQKKTALKARSRQERRERRKKYKNDSFRPCGGQIRSFYVTWKSQDDRYRTRGANGVKDFALELVRETEARIPTDYRRIICHDAFGNVELVHVDEEWVTRALPSYRGCMNSIHLNVAWFVPQAGRRDDLTWEVAVAFAELYVDAMRSFARVGYHETHRPIGSMGPDAKVWRRPGRGANPPLERIIRNHGDRGGNRELAKAVARGWGIEEVSPSRPACLRCTPGGIVNPTRATDPDPDAKEQAPSTTVSAITKVEARKLDAAIGQLQEGRLRAQEVSK